MVTTGGLSRPPVRLGGGGAPGKCPLLEGSGLDVGVAGVGLTAAGRGAEVPRDAAIWQNDIRLERISLVVVMKLLLVRK